MLGKSRRVLRVQSYARSRRPLHLVLVFRVYSIEFWRTPRPWGQRLPSTHCLARETADFQLRAAAAISRPDDDAWDELAAQVAIASVGLTQRMQESGAVSSRAESKVADAVRLIEAGPDAALSLDSLARQAGMSPYHFLRVFSAVSSDPHQYAARAAETSGCALAARRAVANHRHRARLGLPRRVVNFNHAFRTEFGVSPRRYRSEGSFAWSSGVSISMNAPRSSTGTSPSCVA